MFITRIVVIALFLSLGACASSPNYVAADSADDYGHFSRKISENRYRVHYNGNRRTSFQDTRDYALLRAAELTLAEGYDWFEIVDRESLTHESRREPETRFGYERAYYVNENCTLTGCTRRVHPTTYARMDFDTGRPETRHTHSLEIVMGEGELPDSGTAYDAQQVVKAIYRAM
ncbi:MAG: hypothetical protein R3288_00145 [Woeseiaceae bacterium]|nr:hypothetical protein [Woeseiaceae bacterium]